MDEIQNGDRVMIRNEGREVFTVSQCFDGRQCWIGDEQGRGWYISPSRLVLVEQENENEDK